MVLGTSMVVANQGNPWPCLHVFIPSAPKGDECSCKILVQRQEKGGNLTQVVSSAAERTWKRQSQKEFFFSLKPFTSTRFVNALHKALIIKARSTSLWLVCVHQLINRETEAQEVGRAA